jgi:hypothetical protein
MNFQFRRSAQAKGEAAAVAGVYTEYLDILTALITQLAVNPRWSRTLKWLADDLSLPESEVHETLDSFSSLFRENRDYYSLHARAALRDEDEAPELRADILKVLLEYVLNRAAAEVTQSQFRDNLRQARRNSAIAAGSHPNCCPCQYRGSHSDRCLRSLKCGQSPSAITNTHIGMTERRKPHRSSTSARLEAEAVALPPPRLTAVI